jgi:hypothetical protein
VLINLEDGFDFVDFDLDGFMSDEIMDLVAFDKGSIMANYKVGKDLVHKRGMKQGIETLVDVVCVVGKGHRSKVSSLIEFVVLLVYGKRNMKKEPVNMSKLTSLEKSVYLRICKELSNPVRRERIFKFIQHKDITKRLINYFVVHYILVQKEISYYLDKRTYPYTIIGEFNQPNQRAILELISKGFNVVWVNLHQEYKTSKNKKGRRNLHAPYARSVSVKENLINGLSLCELNFYIWLDDVGGFDAFYAFENDTRERKSQYDEEKRTQDGQERDGNRKKRKIVLKNTDGKNYKTFVVNYERPSPFSSLKSKSTKMSTSAEILAQFNS